MNYPQVSTWFLVLSKHTYVVALVDIKVSLLVSLVGSPDGAGHAGPWLLECQDTLNIVAVDLLTGDGVDEGGLNAEEGQRAAAGLGGSDAGKRSESVRTGLGLPVGLEKWLASEIQYQLQFVTYVDNVALLLSDNLKVPLPDLCSNGLTDRAQDSEVSELASDVLVTGTLEQSQGSRGDVELGDVVALNDVPVS